MLQNYSTTLTQYLVWDPNFVTLCFDSKRVCFLPIVYAFNIYNKGLKMVG